MSTIRERQVAGEQARAHQESAKTSVKEVAEIINIINSIAYKRLGRSLLADAVDHACLLLEDASIKLREMLEADPEMGKRWNPPSDVR